MTREARTREYIAVLERGGLSAARTLLKRGVDPSLVLLVTLEYGPAELVLQILKKGAKVNGGKGDGLALLTANQAVLERKKKMKLLLDAGANVNATVEAGKRTLLTHAVLNQDDSLARFLVEQGAAVNRRDAAGSTPLGLAAQTGQKALADYLRQAGATP